MGDENDKVKLYIRLPVKIKEELQVKNLHPDILAVHLPRQKSRCWCFIDFKDRETLLRVREELKKTKVGDKKITVKEYTRGGRTANIFRRRNKASAKDINTSVEPLLELLKKEEKE